MSEIRQDKGHDSNALVDAHCVDGMSMSILDGQAVRGGDSMQHLGCDVSNTDAFLDNILAKFRTFRENPVSNKFVHF